MSSETKRNILPWTLVAILAIALILAMYSNISNGASKPSHDFTSPFTISVDARGGLVVKDSKGEPIKPIPTEKFYPRNVSQISSVQSFTLIEIVGSHYYALQFGGSSYLIPLGPPHP